MIKLRTEFTNKFNCSRIRVETTLCFQVIPDQGMVKRGGHSLTGFYLNMSELNIIIFMKYFILVLNRLTQTNKTPGKQFINLRGTLNIG